ncbi:MAG: SH3 domain-containing protein [Verrucomicrobiota bacterium]
MKSIRYIVSMCLMVGIVGAVGIEVGKSVFVKRDQAPLLDSPNPEGAKIQALKWGKEYSVKKVEGNWAELSVDGKSGWVYKGNLTDQEPSETGNKNSFSSGSTDASASLAARGLDKTASAYAKRQDHGESAEQVEWVEAQNKEVTKAVVTQYLKDHQQGEYAGGAK